MGLIKFAKGIIWGKDKKNVPDLETALEQIAECKCGGIDCCYGFISLIDTQSGLDYLLYIHNGAVVVEERSVAIANLKTYKANRQAGLITPTPTPTPTVTPTPSA